MIRAYNKIGFKSFGHGNDEQLKEWGNSEDEIRQLKIDAIKERLQWYKEGIETYKILNELHGGKNVL